MMNLIPKTFYGRILAIIPVLTFCLVFLLKPASAEFIDAMRMAAQITGVVYAVFISIWWACRGK